MLDNANALGTATVLSMAAGTTLTLNQRTFAGGISGSGGLVKSAAGNLVLSGSNSYTGPTSITAGRLSVNGSLGNTAVTVQSGAELGGIGNLDIAAGTLLEFSDLAGLAAQPFVEDTTVFAMINYTGTWNGGLITYNSQTLTNGSRFFVGSQMWEIDYAYVYDTVTPGSTVRPLNFQGSHVPASGTQTFVTITAVPEPATLALFAAAAAGLAATALARRRRRKRIANWPAGWTGSACPQGHPAATCGG